jgi:hypothetical protein
MTKGIFEIIHKMCQKIASPTHLHSSYDALFEKEKRVGERKDKDDPQLP